MDEGVVIFDAAEFRAYYPNIKATDAQLEMLFFEAELILNNTRKSCVKDLKKRKHLLYLIVAHLATLQDQLDGGNTMVGRISSASQGSVSVSSDYGTMSNSERWWVQTPYGAKYWQLTAPYRTGMVTIPTNFPMPVDRSGWFRRGW